MSEARKSDLVDIACEIRMEKEKAIAIWDGQHHDGLGKREKWTWLPKSQIEVNDDGTVTMPEWLVLDKGLI